METVQHRFASTIQRLGQPGTGLVAAFVIIATALLLALGVDGLGTSAGSSATTSTGAKVLETTIKAPMPIDRIDLTPSQRAELRRLTDTPQKAAAFEINMEKAFAAFGEVGSGPIPTARSASASTQTLGDSAGLVVEPAFAQGWSRDHWWLTMSYADAAYGGIAAATAACSVYLPWFICAPIGAILASWVAGYGTAGNHGVWVAIYRSGWITGGRW